MTETCKESTFFFISGSCEPAIITMILNPDKSLRSNKKKKKKNDRSACKSFLIASTNAGV